MGGNTHFYPTVCSPLPVLFLLPSFGKMQTKQWRRWEETGWARLMGTDASSSSHSAPPHFLFHSIPLFLYETDKQKSREQIMLHLLKVPGGLGLALESNEELLMIN